MKQNYNEVEQIVIPKSFKRIKGTLFSWFSWKDLFIIIPYILFLLIPIFIGINISTYKNIIPWLITDIITLGVVLLLIYPLTGNEKKGYFYIYKWFLYLITKTTYKDKSIKFSFPFDKIENDMLTSKKNKAMVIQFKGIDISLYQDDIQSRKTKNFGNIFNNSNSPISLIKFTRRQDYEAWIKQMSKDLNLEIMSFLYENKSEIKDWKKYLYIVRSNKYTWSDVFDDVVKKNILNQDLVFQFQMKLENLAINIDNISNINDNQYFEPMYFIVIQNTNEKRLRQDYEYIFSVLNKESHHPKKILGNELMTFINSYYVKNNIKPSEVFLDDVDFEYKIEDVIPKKIVFKNSYYKQTFKNQEEIYCKVATFSSLPHFVSRGWLSNLFSSTEESIILKTKDYSSDGAINLVNKKIRTLKTNLSSAKGESDRMALEKEINSFMILLDSLQQGMTLQKSNIFILFTGKSLNEIRVKFRAFKRKIKVFGGYTLDPLTFQQKDGYSGILPTTSDIFSKSEYQTIPTYAIQEGYPATTDKKQDVGSAIIGTTPENVPVMIDVKKRDNHLFLNSNIIVFGTPGTGKSFFTKKLSKDLLSNGVRWFLIDPENEYETLTKNFGGANVNMGAGGNIINPLQMFGSKEYISGEYESHEERVTSFLKTASGLTDAETRQIPMLLSRLYKSKKVDLSKSYDVPNKKWPILEDLVKFSKKEAERQTKRKEWTYLDMQQIWIKLNSILHSSLKKRLWNGHTNININDSSIITFNIKDLGKLEDTSIRSAQMQQVLTFVFKQVSDNKDKYFKPIGIIESKINDLNLELRKAKDQDLIKKIKGKIKIKEIELKEANAIWSRKWVGVAVDEAHLLFDKDNEYGAKFLSQLNKRIRKYHGVMAIISQNPSDFTSDKSILKYTKAIIHNTQYKFIFGLSSSDIKDLDELLKEDGGLSVAEKEVIASSQQGLSVCFFTREARMIMQTYTSEKERQIMGVNSAV